MVKSRSLYESLRDPEGRAAVAPFPGGFVKVKVGGDVRTWQREGRESSGIGLGLARREASLGQSLKPQKLEVGCLGGSATIPWVFFQAVSLFSHLFIQLSLHTHSH